MARRYDSSKEYPNRKENEIPESYIKTNLMKEMHITSEDIFNMYFKDFNYKDYLVFNYVMVDVKDTNNINKVKNDIEDKVKNAMAIINIEDTSSYMTYQGEIDEGKTYVGVFSGLFLFIAMLSVITTMTRKYLESLGIEYKSDALYTNSDLSTTKEINNVETIQDLESLKESMNKMLSMMKTMLVLIIGLPLGFYLTDWLFKIAIEEHYDFAASITIRTYIISAIGTFIISYLVSTFLSKKIKNIDMVSSLKGNE